MASTAQINIKIDSKQAQNTFGDLRKGISDTSTQLDKLIKKYGENSSQADAQRKVLARLSIEYDTLSNSVTDLGATFDEVSQGTLPMTSRLGEIEDRLYELALAGKNTSREFTDLVGEAGRLRQTIIQTDLSVDAMATTMSQRLLGASQGLLGGFAAVQGAMGLMGAEGEEVQQALLKVQSAMAILQGVDAFKQSLPSIKALGSSLVGLLPKLGGATVAQGTLNTVMAANPVMIIVLGIGALIAAFSLFGDTEESVEDQTKRLNKELDASTGAIERLTNKTIAYQKLSAGLEQYQSNIAQLKLDNELIKAEDKLADLRRNTPNAYGAIKQAIEGVADINKRRADADLSHSMALKKQADDELFAQKTLTQEKINNLEEFLNTSQDAEEKLLKRNELKDLRLELTVLTNEWGNTYRMIDEANAVHSNKMLEITTEMNNQLAEETKRAQEEKLKKQEEYNNKLLEYYNKLEEDRIANITDAREKELQEAATTFDEMAGLADDAHISDAVAKENYRKKIKEINDKYDKIDRDKQLEIDNQKKLDLIQTQILNEEAAKNLALLDADTNAERLTIEKLYGDSLRKLKIDEINVQKDIELSNTNLTEEERQKIIAKSEKDISDIRITGMKDLVDETTNALQVQAEKASEFLNLWGTKLTEITSSINSLLQQQTENRIQQLDSQYQTESDKLQSQLDERILSEDEYNAQKRALDQQRQQDENALKRKQFDRDKANNIVQAIMSGAQSVLQALGSLPPPASFIMAGINTALSAVQIATISSQHFKAARGGIVPGSGPGNIDSVPSMLAPGEAVINSTSASMFPNTLSMINQMGGGISLAPDMPSQGSTGSSSIFGDNKTNQPLKAYVVETEITSSQKRINRIERSIEF